MDPIIIVQIAIVNASEVILSTPKSTPTALVPILAAVDSNITEPIKDKRIQATGPPTVINKDNIPDKTTIEGPIEVMAALRMASFICPFVKSTFSPAA